MKKCGCQSVRKHREIKNVEKYTTLYISSNFGALNKTKITYLEAKEYFVRSGKGLITSMSLNNIIRPKKLKMARFAITNVNLKDISRIIKGFGDFTYDVYVRKWSKHMPTDSYLYLAIQLAKCMMRSNLHIGPVRMKMNNIQNMNNYEMSMKNIPISHVYSLGKNKLKRINVNTSEPESNIVNACYSDESK